MLAGQWWWQWAAGGVSGTAWRCRVRWLRGRFRDDGPESFAAGTGRDGGGGEVLGDGEAGPGGRERGPGGRGAGGGAGRDGRAVRLPADLGGRGVPVPGSRGAGGRDQGRG